MLVQADHRSNAECRGIPYAFYTDGTFAVLVVYADTVTGYYGATVTDATHAHVFGRWTKQDLSDYRNALGDLRLSSTGNGLTVDIHAVICGSLGGRFDEHRYPARPAIRVMLGLLASR